MRFPESWLREWVATELDTEALSERLTLLGLEVDSVEPVAPPFSGVVVGRIDAVEPHPEADKLRVCRVDDGTGTAHQVVCGAPNAAVGLHAPFARVGAVLPDGTVIKATKLRGVESAGMLCSATELGAGEAADGLWDLGDDATVGADLRAHAELDASIFEIDLTPNRGDCLSLRGLARELAAATGEPVQARPPEPVMPALDDRFPVTLSAPTACPRYAGRVIRGVDPKAESPRWLRRRLEQCGVRPIQPLVDVTNLVMLELGQPMHAFDLAKLTGGIDVRMGRPDETIDLLDERTVTVDDQTLLIADEGGPVALAGIMGGARTAVSEDTVDVFLESACFLPHAMAGRARRYATHTDSSHRFERGVDPELAPVAIERATELIESICGGRAGPVDDQVNRDHLPPRATIELRTERLRRLLGYAPAAEEVGAMLERLGMTVEPTADGWGAEVPSWRFDLAIESDLIEEVARLYGYNRAPRTHPRQAVRIAPQPETRRAVDALRDGLVERGWHEAVTYSFVDADVQAAVDPDPDPLALANPLSSDMGVMRTSIWSGLIQTAVHNLNRQQERVRLFEIGKRFRPQGEGSLSQTDGLAGLAVGPCWPEQWSAKARETDFFDVKGDVEALLAPLGLARFRFQAAAHPALHPGQSARIEREGVQVGWIGTLHPRLQERFDLARAPVLFEIDLEPLLDQPLPAFGAVSRYPAIRRDLAIIVDEQVTSDALLASVREAAPEELRDAFVFDVYRGKGIDSGRKSLALGLILQGLSRTLTDSEVDNASNDVLAHLRSTHGATLRE
jgi:phenylalanyl-tRNA synthetase beta chain